MSAELEKSPDVAARRERLVALCRSLPEAEAERAGAQHLAFKVRKKIFAYYAYDHHGDGRIALLCKAPPGEQGRLVEESPRRYFVPPYVGPKGWVGMRLDTPRLDWRAVKNLALVAYFLTAPDSLRKARRNPDRRIRRRSSGPKRSKT
jgi:phosphoribosylglycinamide formyltransferase-1